MKTYEITFGSSATTWAVVGSAGIPMPPKRVKADQVKYDKDSNMILFIEGNKAAGDHEKTVYSVDRNAVLAVETF
jgi:hypothetical protein